MTTKISFLRCKTLVKASLLQNRPLIRKSAVFIHHDLRFSSSSSSIKSWDKEVYKSDGDYRKESILEEHIGSPLYELQHELPRLPVPPIEETVDRFLPTALPLAKTNEEVMALKAACERFPEEAKVLQERLIDRRENEMKDSSFLQKWWNQLGYLQVRDSVVYNVSYFLHFKDDPTIQQLNPANVQRAAACLFATAEFRKKVCSGQLPAERVGKKLTPLCSTAYKYMFNACRIPQPDQDSYWIYDPSKHKHAVVARKNQFFAIDFVDDLGDPLPVHMIERQLEQCIEIADTLQSSRPQFGLLTTSNRDTWANAREQLIKSGGKKMEAALEILQSGAIVVNLDDQEPISRQDCGELFLSGGLSSGANRWFDKSVNLVVTENGKAAVLGEHSMMDGMPLVNYASYVTTVPYKDAKERSSESISISSTPDVVDIFADALEDLDWSVVEDLECKAWDEFEAHVRRQANTAQSFHGYGSDFMKKAGHSPDAFVQMAIQLATYRLFGEQVGTYEATQVRPFLHGRTETTRTVSLENEEFVKKMGLKPEWNEEDPVIRKEKLDLLKRATTAHSQYTALAAQAKGVDRHFFGLSMLVNEDENTPTLYSDPLFVKSKRWRVSTSHLTHPNFVNWGFGQVVEDGVGIAYSIHPQSCIFNISALEETNWTQHTCELLEEALLELQRLVELDQTLESKL